MKCIGKNSELVRKKNEKKILVQKKVSVNSIFFEKRPRTTSEDMEVTILRSLRKFVFQLNQSKMPLSIRFIAPKLNGLQEPKRSWRSTPYSLKPAHQ